MVMPPIFGNPPAHDGDADRICESALAKPPSPPTSPPPLQPSKLLYLYYSAPLPNPTLHHERERPKTKEDDRS